MFIEGAHVFILLMKKLVCIYKSGITSKTQNKLRRAPSAWYRTNMYKQADAYKNVLCASAALVTMFISSS